MILLVGIIILSYTQNYHHSGIAYLNSSNMGNSFKKNY